MFYNRQKHYLCQKSDLMTTTLIYFFSSINVLLALMMIIYNWRINKNVLFLAGFLMLLSLESTMMSIFNFGGNLTLYTFLFLISPLYFLKAPLLYFFVRGIVQDRFYLNKNDMVHFIPFFIHLFANIPFLLLSYQDQYRLSASIMQNYDLLREVRFTIYPIAWNNVARAIQLFVYLIASFVMMRRMKQKSHRLKGQLKYQYQYTTRSMSLLLLIVFMIASLLLILNYMFSLSLEKTDMVDFMYYLSHLIMYLYFLVPLFVILSPKFLYGLPHLETKHISAVRFDENEEAEAEQAAVAGVKSPKYQSEYYTELAEKILNYINEEKPYLNKDFQVKDICIRFVIPQHHVHYCLNEILKTDFQEIKNEKRVAYAKNLLKEKNTTVSIEDIGYMSGFGTELTFNMAFKKYTGFTPSQWLKQLS